MYCSNCGKERMENSRYCQHCGNKQKRNYHFLWIFISLVFIGSIGYYFFNSDSEIADANFTSSENSTAEVSTSQNKENLEIAVTEKKVLEPVQERELTDIIASAQETVYTVFTDYSQGSGFLYNNNGTVVTNAHVVEGATDVYIKTISGQEFLGKVIGYSNSIDVAVVHVPDLVGREPIALEVSEPNLVGEEVIALGSPLGLENTATMGYITGQDRNFYIGSYTYENLYQVSAPISPGSSGGPLISKSSEKIIAINSAESTADSAIGFSIPLYTVNQLITSWIEQPMSEEAVLAQFYDTNGNLYYEDLWSYSDGYFDGGYYSEDNSYYDYWEYDYEDWEENYEYDDYYSEYEDEYSEYEDDYSEYEDEYSEFEDDYSEYEDEYSEYEDDYSEYEDEYSEYEDDYSEYEDEYSEYDESDEGEYEDEIEDEEWVEEDVEEITNEFENEAVYFDSPLEENWHYDEQYNEWYYYDEQEDTWYFYEESEGLFYEAEGFEIN
ncbi:trypsin-like peptidase domain-containing protein [Oceanobacillus sp. CF4.6]|uniref:trypsin-like peptidase domain-containing protein n=1 Tax=Oceanobacillus sp. CF4.6 TaxID=3373080 RepID=UPI003EE76F6F